jgi:short-subunit dehydrogenase
VADITAALERDGLPLGALINNAGIAQKYPVEFHPMSAMRRIFEVRGRPPCL